MYCKWILYSLTLAADLSGNEITDYEPLCDVFCCSLCSRDPLSKLTEGEGGRRNGNVSKSNLLPAADAGSSYSARMGGSEGKKEKERGREVLMVTLPNRLRICQLTRRFDDFAVSVFCYSPSFPLSLLLSFCGQSRRLVAADMKTMLWNESTRLAKQLWGWLWPLKRLQKAEEEDDKEGGREVEATT